MAQQNKKNTGRPMTEQERAELMRRRNARLAVEQGRADENTLTPEQKKRLAAQQEKLRKQQAEARAAAEKEEKARREEAARKQAQLEKKRAQAAEKQRKEEEKQRKAAEKQQKTAEKERKKAEKAERKRLRQEAKQASQPKPGSHTAARRARRKRAIITLAALVIFIVVGAVLSVTVLFKIEDYRVEGESIYTSAQLEQAFGHPVGENMFRFKMEEAEAQMQAKLPYLETVKVRRRLPGTVVFIVTPAQEHAYIEKDDGTAVILSETLRVLDDNAPLPEGLLRIAGCPAAGLTEGNAFIGADAAKEELLRSLLAAVEASGIEGLTAVDVSDEYELSAVWQGRITLRLGTVSQLEYKFAVVQKALQTGTEDGTFTDASTGVIDASTAGRAYYRP